MRILRKKLIAKIWKFLEKAFMMEFFSVKLQTLRDQSAPLLERELTTDTFWNMYRKLATTKEV